MRFAPILACVLISLSVAGCANGPNGQSASDGGSLAYNGASSGSHNSSFDCDGSGEAAFAANLGGGSATVTVKDAAGKTVYSKTANGPGQTAETKDITGTAGTWTVSASRTSGFSGQYALDVDC
ncbi:MAG: hypothetical protein WC876_10380 [Candidatus Thermoplasmatota archaeon]